MDNQLAYIDQASFLGLRALGHSPQEQFCWIYDRPIDIDALRRLHANLGYTLLGRLIERSPLPFGRHRWVAAAHQADLDVAPAPRPREEMLAWFDEQMYKPIDPEHGPAWRMAVLPFTDGGGAVTLIVSHSVADGSAAVLSVVAALHGHKIDLGYPPPRSRPRGRALREDLREIVRALPEMKTALGAAIKLGREESSGPKPAPGEKPPVDHSPGAKDLTIIPTVAAYVPCEVWDAHAASLGGTSNSLVAAVATRLGKARGRIGPDGLVTINFPVSERTLTDTRANALTGMTIQGNPDEVTTSLTGLRTSVREGFKSLEKESNKLIAPLPLIPLTSKRLLRRLGGMAQGVDKSVGCSNVGEIPEDVSRIDGGEATSFWARGVEWPTTREQFDEMGGSLMVASIRMAGTILVLAQSWRAGGPNTKEELAEQFDQALKDMGITATLF
ncbi:hypothetical protein [Mycobacterium sp. M26]|uniref:hypothetical protein n=1 Tax=Mycobacterium sp. M26 TaxID=1762962 RepID=UPI00073E3D47|nr:hypothetical protein [Mycobacterium sp. M26]